MQQSNIIRTQKPINLLRVGDTVEYRGELLTVGKNDVKYDSFMGYSFRGDASKKLITFIQFAVPTLGGEKLR